MKKFLIKLSYTVLPVFVILLGLETYVSLYVVPKATGDLGHLAYIPFDCQDASDDEGEVLLYKDVHSLEELKRIHVNVLNIGDSFSRQGVCGYQNYLTKQGVSVANCYSKLYDNPIQYAYHLLNERIIDSTHVDVIIVEIGERDIVRKMESFSVDKKEKPIPQSNEIVSNKWSLLRARDFLVYRLGLKKPVRVVDLNNDFFDSKDPRQLYFYYADLEEMSVEEPFKHKIKEVFDLMLNLANEKGIGFLLMIPVDKYDLYQDYIVDNPYPHPKTINEDVREILGDTANLMLCKYYLKPMLEKGEKDVFLFDDSHWSSKAAKVVGEELGRRVKKLMRLKSIE